MRLPDHVFETAKKVAAKYPGPASDEILAKALNEIAWTHRADPVRNEKGEVVGVLQFGLSEKRGGRHIVHPELGPIAEDILQLPDGTHWDIFTSAGHGNPLRPNQGESIVPNTPRRWVAPVKPKGEVLIPPPDPDPEPDPEPEPLPPPVEVVCEAATLKGDIQAVYELIAHKVIAEHIGELYRRLAVLEGKLDTLLAREGECKIGSFKLKDLL